MRNEKIEGRKGVGLRSKRATMGYMRNRGTPSSSIVRLTLGSRLVRYVAMPSIASPAIVFIGCNGRVCRHVPMIIWDWRVVLCTAVKCSSQSGVGRLHASDAVTSGCSFKVHRGLIGLHRGSTGLHRGSTGLHRVNVERPVFGTRLGLSDIYRPIPLLPCDFGDSHQPGVE